jgi:hypothetical protein
MRPTLALQERGVKQRCRRDTSTTETADYLLREWGLRPHAVVKWGPMKTQTLSEVKKGRLLVIGFAGNSAPDHVDELHSLPQ